MAEQAKPTLLDKLRERRRKRRERTVERQRHQSERERELERTGKVGAGSIDFGGGGW